MIIKGVDPGAQGALTLMSLSGDVLDVFPFKDKTSKTIMTKFTVCELTYNCYGFLERVHEMPNDTPKTAFVLGRNYQLAEDSLTFNGIPFETIPPQNWQKIVGLKYPFNPTNTQKEHCQKRLVEQLFPGLITCIHKKGKDSEMLKVNDKRITQKVLASILIAEAGRRIYIRREGIK